MSDRFVRTTTLFGKQYDWWSVDGVLALLPHVPTVEESFDESVGRVFTYLGGVSR